MIQSLFISITFQKPKILPKLKKKLTILMLINSCFMLCKHCFRDMKKLNLFAIPFVRWIAKQIAEF